MYRLNNKDQMSPAPRRLYDDRLSVSGFLNLLNGKPSKDVRTYYESLKEPFKDLINSSESCNFGRLLLLVPLIKSGWTVLDVALDDDKGPTWLPIIATPMEYVPMTFYKSGRQRLRYSHLERALKDKKRVERRALLSREEEDYLESCLYVIEVKSEMASITSEGDRSHIQIHPCFNSHSVVNGGVPHIFGHTKALNSLSPTTEGCALATGLSAFVDNFGYINDPGSASFSREDLLTYNLAPNVIVPLSDLLDRTLFNYVEGENLFDLSQRAWLRLKDHISFLKSKGLKELADVSRAFRL